MNEEDERMKRRRKEKEKKEGKKCKSGTAFFFFLENPKGAARARPDREGVPRRFNTSLLSAEFYSPTIECVVL